MKRSPHLPLPLTERYQWQDRANCRHTSVAVFFGADLAPRGDDGERERRAKEVCRGCPVIDLCLEHALAAEDHGVWGGMTPKERLQVRRDRERLIAS